jgi:hypothetical protein
MADCCEDVNKHLGPIKGGECLEELSDRQLLKMTPRHGAHDLLPVHSTLQYLLQ